MIYMLLLVGSGCAVDQVSSRTQAVDKKVVYEQKLCDLDACLIEFCADSDADGVCDEDEEACGTDPLVPKSRPKFRDLLRLLAAQELPSFRDGHSMLLVLPTQGPDGEPVFGGEAAFPARESLLKQIGVELPEGAPDLTDGFTLMKSLDTGVEFRRPPWTKPEAPKADTTRDGQLDAGAIGSALKGLKLDDFQIQSASSSDGLNFSQFTFTDQNGHPWSVETQVGPTYAKVHAETDHTNGIDDYRYHQTRDVEVTTDEQGNTTKTTTTHTESTSPDGKQQPSTTRQTREHTSADGQQKFVEHTEANGFEWTEECHAGSGCFGPQVPEEAGETTDEGSSTAHYDPDYVEYTASPEVMDAVLVLRGGPVLVVDPLDDAAQETFIPGLDNNIGPVSLYAPDSAWSLNEPIIIRMPRGGDYDPNAPEPLTAEKAYEGGKCIYCSEDGD